MCILGVFGVLISIPLRIIIPVLDLALVLKNLHGSSQVPAIRSQELNTRYADAQVAVRAHVAAFLIGNTASLAGERVVRIARVDELIVVQMTVVVSVAEGIGRPHAIHGAGDIPLTVSREERHRCGGGIAHGLFRLCIGVSDLVHIYTPVPILVQ